MAAPEFVHLHTEFSLLDGACHLDELAKHAKSMGMSAMAITDHEAMFGAVGWAAACKKADIKPIIGFESYVALGSRLEKSGGGIANAYNHLGMIASSRLAAWTYSSAWPEARLSLPQGEAPRYSAVDGD